MTGPLAPILSRAIYLRSFLHGTTGFFYHQASGLKADLLDGLGRRRARFGMEARLNWRDESAATSANSCTVNEFAR